MSSIGGPIAAGVAGAPEASRSANKAKEKPRNDKARQRRRFEDALELHVSSVESADAVHNVKEHASEDADSERQAKQQPHFHQRPFNPAAGGLSRGYAVPSSPPSSAGEDPQSKLEPTSGPPTSLPPPPPPPPPPPDPPRSTQSPPNESIDVTG